MNPRRRLLVRWVIMLVAYAVFGYSIDITVAANLGVSPWDVLHLGVADRLGITLGQASFGTGAVVVLVGWALGVAPKWGTLANITVISYFVDFYRYHDLVISTDSMAGRIALFVAGTFINAIVTAVYTSLHLGAGPRDGLMLALTARLKRSVSLVRIVMEVGVVAAGWLIGGPVGIGTVLAAVLLGPFVQAGYRLVGLIARGRVADVLQPPVAMAVKHAAPAKEVAQGG